MINLKEEQKKIADYLEAMSEERGYTVKNRDYDVEISWSRYYGDFVVNVSLEARGVGFVFIEISYRCHTRLKKGPRYANLFSLDHGICEAMLCDMEKEIVRDVESFEQKLV